ncbi:MAG TPA: 4-(cytidine 5'-diphospho)-2-C-methyl-D-erythritol kinase [Bryobacteraceae bacterium]
MPGVIRRAALRPLAKINLDLRVLHKNPDGFHEIRTVFHTISLADSLELEYQPARPKEIVLDDPASIPDNLVVRAAQATLDALGIAGRLRMRLTKRIPMGGGLGGGSSDAAAVLLAVPTLARRVLPLEETMRIAASLGSDVPFFLLGGAAVGAGRGAELYPLPDLAPEPLLVIVPEVRVSTAEAYRALGRGSSPADPSGLENFRSYVWALEQRRSAAAAGGISANDFEASVFERHPQLGRIRARLAKLGAAGARLTGSGSALVALFHSMAERRRVEEQIEGDPVFRNCRVLRARLINRRSYRRQLGL